MFPITHLAGEVVLLVRVLAGGELAVEKGHSLVRLVFDDLHPLAPARLVLRGLRHGEQLRHLQNIRWSWSTHLTNQRSVLRPITAHLVLLHRHRQRYPVFLYNHL